MQRAQWYKADALQLDSACSWSFLLYFLLPSLMYTMHDVLLSSNDRQLSLRSINNTDSPPGAGCKAQSSTSAHEGQPARGTAAQSC